MIFEAAPDAPLVVKAAAASLLYLHIGGASLGLASGTVAAVARKGGALHRRSGALFFVSMLAMSAAAAITGPLIPDRATAMMGVFTFYLTLTAWLAVRRPPATVGRLEAAALVLGAATVVALAWLAGVGMASPGGMIDGEQSYTLAIVVGAIAALAVGLDLRVLRLGGLSGVARVSRHLWRMCLALFIAWGSFAGQPKAVPEAVRGSPLLFLPALATLGLLAFWMIRVRMSGRRALAAA